MIYSPVYLIVLLVNLEGLQMIEKHCRLGAVESCGGVQQLFDTLRLLHCA